MECTRCGAAEAVVKRDNANYCGRCAVARDWSDVIAMVQDGPRGTVTVEFVDSEPATAAPVLESNGGGPATNASADPFAL